VVEASRIREGSREYLADGLKKRLEHRFEKKTDDETSRNSYRRGSGGPTAIE